VVLCSASGLSARQAGERLGFAEVTSDEAAVINDPRVKAVFVLTRHDQHARQVALALSAGKHVFCEKPLALNEEELVAVEAALGGAAGGAPLLMVGFNRRFSPAAREVKTFFEGAAGPRTVSIRFNAGAIPPEHWTQVEEVGGGRIVGEACHAIDLATFLIGAPPVRVFAESVRGGPGQVISDDQAFITMRHADGSISNVAYLSGGDRSYPKERVEILGGGRLAVIEDFREVVTCVGGRRKRVTMRQDKGHEAEVQALSDALLSGGPAPIPWPEIRAVSLASILAVRSLREGVPFDLP
jgi:predicted dehydrogenase